MPSINYEGRCYSALENESVLDTLLRNNVPVTNSCRAGVCGSCMLRAAGGVVPARAQSGLKETLKANGYFLSCLCRPESDLEIAQPGDECRVGAIIESL